MPEREPTAAQVSARKRPSAMFLIGLYTAFGAVGICISAAVFKPRPTFEELVISRLMLPSSSVYSRVYLEQPENKKILRLILAGCRLQVGFRFEQCQAAQQAENQDDWEEEAGLIRI